MKKLSALCLLLISLVNAGCGGDLSNVKDAMESAHPNSNVDSPGRYEPEVLAPLIGFKATAITYRKATSTTKTPGQQLDDFNYAWKNFGTAVPNNTSVFDYSVTVRPNNSVVALKSEFYPVQFNSSLNRYEFRIELVRKCEVELSLSSAESNRIFAAYERLNLCAREVQPYTGPGSTISIRLPPGVDMWLGIPHYLKLDQDGNDPMEIDFTGAAYSGYVHKYVCGENFEFNAAVRDAVNARDLNDCPSIDSLFESTRAIWMTP